ncbi:fibronectin-like [Ciona intestinalis]
MTIIFDDVELKPSSSYTAQIQIICNGITSPVFRKPFTMQDTPPLVPPSTPSPIFSSSHYTIIAFHPNSTTEFAFFSTSLTLNGSFIKEISSNTSADGSAGYIIHDLVPGETYNLSSVGYIRGIIPGPPFVTTVTTRPLPVINGTVTTDVDRINFTFSQVEGMVSSYRVHVVSADDPSNAIKSGTVLPTHNKNETRFISFDIGQDDGIRYLIYVDTHSSGQSSTSAPFNATLRFPPNVLPNIEIFTSPTTLTVKLNETQNQVDYFVISITESSTPLVVLRNRTVTHDKNITAVFSNLKPNTEYVVMVRTKVREVQGNVTSLPARTDSAPRVVNVTAHSNLTSITVSFNTENWNNEVDRFELSLSNASNPNVTLFRANVSTEEMETTFVGLQPETNYIITLNSVVEESKSVQSYIDVTTALLPTVTFTMDSTYSSVSVNITSNTSLIDFYHVSVKQFGEINITAEKILSADSNLSNILFELLLPNTTYEVQVTALVSNIPGPINTKESQTKILPTGLDFNVTTNVTSAIVNIQILPNFDGDYFIKAVPDNPNFGSYQTNLTIHSSVASVLLEGLRPDTEYTVSISTVYSGKLGPARAKNATTLVPPPPTKWTATSDVTSLVVGILPPDVATQVDSYVVLIRESSKNITVSVKTANSTNVTQSITFKNLVPSTKYTVEIYSIVSGVSSPRDSENVTTVVLDPVVQWDLTSTPSSIQVKLYPVNQTVDGYTVWLTNSNGTSLNKTVTINSTKTGENLSATFTHLSPLNDYIVYAVANINEFSSNPKVNTIKTLPPPSVLIWDVQSNASDVVVDWEPVNPTDAYFLTISFSQRPLAVQQQEEIFSISNLTRHTFLNLYPGQTYNVTINTQYLGINGTSSSKNITVIGTEGWTNFTTSSTSSTVMVNITATDDKQTFTHYKVSIVELDKPDKPYVTLKIPLNDTNPSVLFNNLISGKDYLVVLQLQNNSSTNPPVVKLVTTFSPTAPLNVVVSNKTSTTIKLQWEYDASVTSYTISATDLDSTNRSDYQLTSFQPSGTIMEYLVTDLMPDAMHTLTLVPLGKNVGSIGENITIQARTMKPAGIQNISVVTRNLTETSLQVLPQLEPADLYTVIITQSGNATVVEKKDIPTSDINSTIYFKHLEPNTTYTVTAISVLKGVESNITSIEFTTLAFPPPVMFQNVSTTNSSLLVTWPSVYPADKYILSLAYSGTPNESLRTKEVVRATFINETFENLIPGVEYTVRINAQYMGVNGISHHRNVTIAWSDDSWGNFTIDPDHASIAVEIIPVPLPRYFLFYNLTISYESDPSVVLQWKSASSNNTNPFLIFTDLKAGRAYFITLHLERENGTSYPSKKRALTWDPVIPQNLQVTNSNPTSLEVEWKVDPAVTSYVLTAENLDNSSYPIFTQTIYSTQQNKVKANISGLLPGSLHEISVTPRGDRPFSVGPTLQINATTSKLLFKDSFCIVLIT